MSDNNYTKEEIEAAKRVKADLIFGNKSAALKAAFAAGEICMWDELKQANEANKEQDKALNKHIVSNSVCPKCGSTDCDEDNNVKRCIDCYTIY